MKKIYNIVFSILLSLIIKDSVSALTYGGCDYTTVANLKKLVNNVNVSYSYEIINNEAYFSVTLNNIPEGAYFKDNYLNKTYHYSDTNNGELTINGYNLIKDGNYTFYTDNDTCRDIKLGSKYYKFPIYNTRMNDESCKDIPNFYMCKKWITKYYSDDEFESKIEEYKKNLNETEEFKKNIIYKKDFLSKFMEFYIKYYYIFLPIIIIICIIVITISNRKNKFKL